MYDIINEKRVKEDTKVAQSFIAGTTNYSEQSIKEIRSDILYWIEYAEKIKELFLETITNSKRSKYWYKVAFDFAAFCESVPMICDTFCEDFKIIVDAIDNDNITKREITLMRNIYKCTIQNEEFSWKTYKGHENGYWHDYGNPEFDEIENLYGKGRDFFITLKDVGNAVSRMEDYMKEEIKTTYVEDNSIHIGDGNKIKNSLFGNRINENKKESFFHKYIWQIIAAIIAGLAVTCICIWLGIK